MLISVVIPTCNRKQRLLALLGHMAGSTCRPREIIIVDSGEDRLLPADLEPFDLLDIQYLQSEKSVCIQRNLGIRTANSPWIFLCDDDIEVPRDYLRLLSDHLNAHPGTGAVSGLVLQKEKDSWTAQYPIRSRRQLLWKFIFKLGIWGAIECPDDNRLTRRLKEYYYRKGNHLSTAGWPVVTDFSGEYFTSPVYGLGASLIKKEWLIRSPYEEVLDRHGIGDNYGVAAGFPSGCIHVLTGAFVFHHQEPVNRLLQPLQYYRRTLALDYFVRTRPELRSVKKSWLLWSLTGNLLSFLLARDQTMTNSAWRSLWMIASGRNPYYKASRTNRLVTEPSL